MTSKLQVTVPKALAEQYGIRPGDDIEWLAAGDTIRVVPASRSRPARSLEDRLEIFDQATERQRERETLVKRDVESESRGWTREELYDRG